MYNFACVNANCLNLCSGLYFHWNFNIPPSFPLIIIYLFVALGTTNSSSAPFGQKCPHWNHLKLIFLIAVPFNCKIIKFLLIGFHSVSFKIIIFYQIVPFFSSLVYKSNTHLFLFSASAYYRENGINNAAVIVCFGMMSESGLYVCHKYNVCVFL